MTIIHMNKKIWVKESAIRMFIKVKETNQGNFMKVVWIIKDTIEIIWKDNWNRLD